MKAYGGAVLGRRKTCQRFSGSRLWGSRWTSALVCGAPYQIEPSLAMNGSCSQGLRMGLAASLGAPAAATGTTEAPLPATLARGAAPIMPGTISASELLVSCCPCNCSSSGLAPEGGGCGKSGGTS